MEQQLIINGLPTQQIKKVKMYVRIVSKRYADDLNCIAENQRNCVASHIVNFMRSIYLTEHPFDELDLCCNLMTEAEHVVNFLYLPKTANLASRVAVCIDFDNMLSLSKKHYKNYQSNRLRLSDVQQLFVEKKQSVIGSRYHIDSSRVLEAPTITEKKKFQHNREVLQIDFDGVVLHTFKTLTEAAKATNISRENIYNCLKHVNNSAGGFVWRYADDDDF